MVLNEMIAKLKEMIEEKEQEHKRELDTMWEAVYQLETLVKPQPKPVVIIKDAEEPSCINVANVVKESKLAKNIPDQQNIAMPQPVAVQAVEKTDIDEDIDKEHIYKPVYVETAIPEPNPLEQTHTWEDTLAKTKKVEKIPTIMEVFRFVFDQYGPEQTIVANTFHKQCNDLAIKWGLGELKNKSYTSNFLSKHAKWVRIGEYETY